MAQELSRGRNFSECLARSYVATVRTRPRTDIRWADLVTSREYVVIDYVSVLDPQAKSAVFYNSGPFEAIYSTRCIIPRDMMA